MGRIQFDIEFQQIQDIQIELRDLTCKLEGKEDRPFYGVFKAITTNESTVSKKTSTLFGEFDKDRNRTVYNWSIS